MAFRKSTFARRAANAPIMDYGIRERAARQGMDTSGWTQLYYDCAAFAYKLTDHGVPRRSTLFRHIAETLVPGFFEWHSWTTRMIDALCEEQWIGVAGAAGSAKTYNSAGFACVWWLCNPTESSVIFCSTTAKALRKRGWADVQKFHDAITGPKLGNLVNSTMQWQAVRGDDRHAIMGIAVEEGEATKIADNIKGVHTRRQLVIVDEATRVPPAIYDACTNLWSYPREFILVLMGNPRQRLDEFGKFCEPLNGWDSVTVDTEEWETTPKINGKTGIVIRFDAERSPNIVEGKVVSKHLPTKEKVEAARNKAGSSDTPTYWSNQRGFWCPEGISKTVITETMLISCDAYGRHAFTGDQFVIIGVLDPARLGDRPTIRYAALGKVTGGIWGIELMPPIVVQLKANATLPIAYQLIEQVKRNSNEVMYRGIKYRCDPKNFGIDIGGGGAELTDVLEQEWSKDVVRIGFGESASQDACSFEDHRPACEVYDNRRAEMYYRFASAVLSKQIRGLDIPSAKELVMIESDESKKRILLITKKLFRKQYGFSPDLADTAVMVLEMARRRGFTLAARGITQDRIVEVSEVFEKSQKVFEDVTYEAEEDYVEA